LLDAATPGKVTSAGTGSPNLLDFVGTSVPPVTTTTSTTTTSTTTTSTTTTTIAAQVPASPVLTGTAAKKAARLTWTAPANGGSAITGYRVYRSSSSTGPFSLRASTGASTRNYNDGGLRSGTRFYYQVAAVNAVGEGARSNTVGVTAG